MKKLTLIVMLVSFNVACGVCRAQFSADMRQSLQAVVQDAVEDLMNEPGVPAYETIGIMPIHNDRDGFVEGLLKAALTKAGHTCVEVKESDFWETVSNQFEWDTRKADILDTETLLEFKKLMGTQLLLYGIVREASETIDRVYVEAEFHISSLETTRHVWGGGFSEREYLKPGIDGIVTLEPKVREVLKNIVTQAAASMKVAPKLSDIKNLVVVSVAGDMENYVKGLLFEVMSNSTGYFPRDLGVRTLAEARQMLRAEPDKGDAVLYGSIRDLSRKLKSDLPLKQIYTVTAEVQLTVQNVQTGDVLWSVTQSDTAEEIIEKPKEEAAYHWFRANKGLVKWILIGLGVVVLFAVYLFISRPRRR
ncbi:hypothetical protein JXA40_07140 [bacterium]|nr:hypothetical protein [candidate division CSSED10-310 bacterium]